MKHILSLSLLCLVALSSCDDERDQQGQPYRTLNGRRPLVIGHRGASGTLPEHTLEAYRLAIAQEADFIEPDVVVTKDGVLICRHEPMLSGTTDVAQRPEFANRKSKKMLDGFEVDDWFASDFTLAEIRTLRAKQAFAERSQQFNGLYLIPTLQEVIDLAKAESATRGRQIGIYPETKHPTFHEVLGLAITDKLLATLTAAGWNTKDAPVYVQSFEVSNLQYARTKSTVKLVQLFDAYDVDRNGNLLMDLPNGKPYDFVVKGDPRTYNDLATNAGLDFIKTYADGIGPWKPYIQPYTYADANTDGNPDDLNGDGLTTDQDYTKLPTTNLIDRAHQRGLVVHAYTFRNELRRLLSDYKNDPRAEYKTFYDLGLDGVFTDFPATAVSAR